MATSKKSTKKATKKKTKKVATKKGSEGPLQAASAVLDSTLKKKDWRVVDSGSRTKSLPHIPMGSIVIDYLIGGKPNRHGVPPCPGMPRGRIMQLYGHEGSGKTTLALTCAASTIAAGGTVCFIDYEHAIVPYYAEALGVPIDDKTKFLLAQPESLDEGMQIAYAMAKAGVDLIVFDSVGAGVPKKILDAELDDVAKIGQIGLLANMWSKFLPKIRGVLGRTGTALIGISQIRAGINASGHGGAAPDSVQGGKAWKFYSDLRLKLRRMSTEKAKVLNPLTNKKEDRAVGAKIVAKLDKCKVSPQQGNEDILYIRQGEGFDDYRTIIEIGIAYNVVKKSGAWIEWQQDGEHAYKVQGMDRFRRKLMETDGAMQTLYERIIPYLGATVTPIEDPVDEDEIGGDEDLEELGDMLASVGGGGGVSAEDG